ncbi:MAG TPA: hypothetical protein VFN10_13810 [Thermoanaerobaculia bacterium]|nr:hypothetical protein [Thermoanaerobaculia bacterium]
MRKALLLLAALALLCPNALRASDHADPMKLKQPLEAGITDLFVFPKGDQMIVIMNVRRALSAAAPYDLQPFAYTVNFDLHTPVRFDSQEDRNRYGGTIATPDSVAPDKSFTIRLHNNSELNELTVNGFDKSALRVYTGVRDDPFIFPRFFGKNVVAMVVGIPFSQFGNQQDFLIWGTSHRVKSNGTLGKQVDHVGRSLRTMLPRFDFLNTIEAGKQTAAIHKVAEHPGFITHILQTKAQPIFGIRHYDYPPDVMIYSKRFECTYPNGRLLTDDVANLTCQQGDCLLFEVSFADSLQYPRATQNDKPFLPDWPYLAAPWPTK